MGIASGIGHLFESIIETIEGVLAIVFHMFESVFVGIFHVFEGAFKFSLSLFSSLVNFVEGTLGFAIHNFLLIGTVAALFFGYRLYTQKQGTASTNRRAVKSN